MSDQAFERVQGIFEGKPQIRKSAPKDLRALRGRVGRVVRRSPEVMVKITGNSKGAGHLQSHLDYITRKGKLEAEDERGTIISGRQDVGEVGEDWIRDGGKRNSNTRDSTNIVLSMPALTDPQAVKDAAREFAKETFAENYQYLFVLHKDADHPHVHLTVKNHGYDGKRLHVKKGDPQKWRESFADHLRRQAVEAEATARAPRGVVRKATRQVLLHLRKRGERPRVDEAKVRGALKEMSEGLQEPRPWEEKISTRQNHLRKEWLATAKVLAQTGKSVDRELAQEIGRFVGAMAPLKTERHEIQERLAAQMRQARERQKGRNGPDPEQGR